MKILHLIHNFPPEFRGGTEIYVQALCRRQAAAGREVVVLAGSEKREWRDDLEEILHQGIRVLRFRRIPGGEDFSVDFYLERFEGLLLDALERERPDLVHLHHWMNLGNEILRAAAGAGIPSVLTLHDLYPICPRFFMTRPDGSPCGTGGLSDEQCIECALHESRGVRRDIEGEFRVRKESFKAEFAAAARVIVPSRAHALPFLKAGLLEPNGFIVLHHGLVRPVSRPVWKENPDRPLRVGTWGNLVPAKGIHVLIDALARAHRTRKGRFEGHLYGPIIEPEYEQELRASARDLPITFHGEFSDLSPEEVGRGLDLAVFPSLARESYSMVLDEAIALGLPVVVSDSGALPERAGRGGIVTPAGDRDALARTLIELEQDRGRLTDLSSSIQEMSWTIEDNRRGLEAIYEEAVREGPRRAADRSRLRRIALLKGRLAGLTNQLNERNGAVLRFGRFREFVPLRDFSTLPRGRVLILAPHPDDEVIGCGGVTALHALRGDAVTVVHLTDGGGGGSSAAEGGGLGAIRRGEAEAAGRILGTEEFIRLDFPDGNLLPDEDTVKRVSALIHARAPVVVYAPSPFEIHPDHLAALFVMLHFLENEAVDFTFLMYEVNEAMVPGFLVDITSVVKKKDEALSCFESQIRLNDVRDKSVSGARWRTANVDLPNVTHCEAFIGAGGGSLRGLIARIRDIVTLIGKGGANHE